MSVKFLIKILTFSLILLSINCAKREFPSGGPVDVTPPQILEVFPANSSLNVDLSAKITITFSKPMAKEKTVQSIFITPVPESPFKFRWKKNSLILEPSKPLEKDKTYVINIGTNAQDTHNNKLEKSYSFAFSTGQKLDSGSISGKVFFQDKAEKGVSIWTYPLSKNKDTNPEVDKPEYATLSGQNGEYTLSYLAKDVYRLFAVKDLNNDLLWEPDKEPLGVTTKDLNLTLDTLSFSNIVFELILRDTTAPQLVSCQSLDKRDVRLEFDESLSPRGLYEKENYKIYSDSLSEKSLNVELVYIKGEDYQKVYLVTDEMSKRKYRVIVQNLTDLYGNKLDQKFNEWVFEGSESVDKSPLRIDSTYPGAGDVNIPLDAEIKLFFEKPPEKNSAEKGFILKDSLEERVEGKFLWENPAELVFKPDKVLQGKMKYELTLKDLVDLWGNPYVAFDLEADTSFKLGFITVDPDTLSSISGRVENLSQNKGEIVIDLKKIEKPELSYEKKLKESGDFKFENVFPGKYNLKAYLDLNGNGVLDLGKPLPFEPAEPEIFYPDTLNLRPRWETEGVILKFR
ncbi:MAG: Ig-like domain-containing protein [candidate division Zixibacteria bacterium]|nr:Ig-like domain-containing protein [candidate division Zixibacteria bacterium]